MTSPPFDPHQLPVIRTSAPPPPEVQAERQSQMMLATRLAALGWLLPVVVLVTAPLFLVLHLAIRELAVWWWWLPLAAIWSVAALCTFYAVANLPRRHEPGRGWVLGQMIAAIVLLVVSGGAFGLTAMVMSVVLYTKSDQGQQELAERRRQAEMTQQQRFAEQRQKLLAQQQEKARLREVERQKRRAEQEVELQQQEAVAAKERAAEEKRLQAERAAAQLEQRRRQEEAAALAAQQARDKEERERKQVADSTQAYTAAIQEMFTGRDNGRPLPEVVGDQKRHRTEGCRIRGTLPRLPELVMKSQPIPGDQPLFDEPFTSAGHTVRRLTIPADRLVPMLACEFWYEQPTAWLLEKQGRLIEIALPGWKPQRTWDLGVPCHFLSSNESSLLALSAEQLLVIDIHNAPYNDGPPRATRLKIVKPTRVMVQEEMELETATSTPLHVQSVLGNCRLQELSLARDPKMPILPSHLGRDVEVGPAGEIFVPQANGIYRANVNLFVLNPDDIREPFWRLNQRCAQFDLKGEQLRMYGSGWQTKELKWKQVIAADNLDLEKFATLHNELLATCNATTNLLLFDRNGQQLSAHSWPDAGRTVHIQGLPSQNQFVIFTENHVYFVAGPQKVKPWTKRPQ